MTQTEPVIAGATPDELPDSATLREQLITDLIESGVLTDRRIEAAFRAVPREVFAPPGTPLALPYALHDVVLTRFTEDGTLVSSLSAPYMLLRTNSSIWTGPESCAGVALRCTGIGLACEPRSQVSRLGGLGIQVACAREAG
ncbi:hypothetical protein [Antribacter gilvus]|uniref:hypothetical protein n=1 Tax=Antribacter gilvus TaxID=2304675 RepID=UPI000F773BDB|nr:hypothetical protein [Antribacter gilvus]